MSDKGPLIWLTSLIISAVGGRNGQVESSKYQRLSPRSPFNGAMLLINRAGTPSSQIHIKIHTGGEVNNGLGLLLPVRDTYEAERRLLIHYVRNKDRG